MLYQRVKNTLKDSIVFDVVVHFRQQKELRDWQKTGELTPHLVKQKVVIDYAVMSSGSTFVETGTYFGFMINAIKRNFRKIYSIELDNVLCQRAQKKFARHNHISIYQGDSGSILPEILNQINEPCLFWLDAHYSGGVTAKGQLETPIIAELKHILTHARTHSLAHIILIDDARCFVGSYDYPTIQEVRELIAEILPDLRLEVKDDIIRIYERLSHGDKSA